jgi:outer membrane protein OmpA-like peptidoglycan-associated protein
MGDLSRLTKFLISNKKYRIEITGFSDDAIEPSTNQYLAALRGNSVKDYLIGNGINSDRISVNEVSATKEIIDLNPNQYVRIKLIR